MSYHKIHIAPLSPAQIGKMLRGAATTIKHGTHHAIHVSGEQLKKASKAFSMGKGVRITMDPYQIDAHHHLRGSGIMSSLKKAAGKVKSFYDSNKAALQPILHQVGQAGIKKAVLAASPLAAKYGLDSQLASAASAADEKLLGMGLARRRRPAKKSLPGPKRGGSLKSVFKKAASIGKAALKNPVVRGFVTKGMDAAAMYAGLPPGQSEAALQLAGLGIRGDRAKPHFGYAGHPRGGALFLP